MTLRSRPATLAQCCAAAGLLAFSGSLPAAGADLGKCAAIDDARARLACYDALAGRPAADAPKRPQAEARFGAESLADPPPTDPQEARALKEIRSRIVSPFTGWERGRRFVLENGQVWQSVDDRSQYFPLEKPEATIRKTWAGGYVLKVQKWEIRVKRIR